MSQQSVARWLRTAEYLYASTVLLALTQGPVYRLWSESATFLPTSPEPTMRQIYFATYVALQLPALVVISRTLTKSFFLNRAPQLLLAFIGWLGLSVVWSTLARQSLPEFVALSATTSFGLYLASRFSLTQLWRIVSAAMAAGLLWSLFAIQRGWELATDSQEQYWIGIYYNRNSLAPVAGIAVLGVVGIAMTTARRRSGDVAILAGATGLLGIAFLMLWRSESQTSPFALAVAVTALMVWLSVRWFTARVGKLTRVRHLAAPATLTVGAITTFVALRTVSGLSRFEGETATFNSRGALWSVNWSGFLEKPFFGWGWMAARKTPEFFRQGIWWATVETEWSHNGYHDILLGGGVLAGVLFAVMIFVATQSFDAARSVRESIPRFLVVCFVLAAATQESFFIGSHFLWALLIAALFASEGIRPSSVDEHHTSQHTA